MFRWQVIAVFALLVCCCESSSLKGYDEIETLYEDSTDLPNTSITETSTDEVFTEPPESAKSEEKYISSENPTSEAHTDSTEIKDGKFFELKMTIEQKWSDIFIDENSETFNNLSNSLGGELIDLIDNSREAKEPNMTNFKLVEVLPSKESKEHVYVTFVVSSKQEISGEELSIAIKNRILLHGSIYTFNATDEGFSLKNITEEEAKALESKQFPLQICGIDDDSEPTTNSSVESGEIFHNNFKCQREKIQRGETSIYIFENQPECLDGVRNGNDEEQMEAKVKLPKSNETGKCSRNVKRSAIDEEETIIVIKKRGNKVFIEI